MAKDISGQFIILRDDGMYATGANGWHSNIWKAKRYASTANAKSSLQRSATSWMAGKPTTYAGKYMILNAEVVATAVEKVVGVEERKDSRYPKVLEFDTKIKTPKKRIAKKKIQKVKSAEEEHESAMEKSLQEIMKAAETEVQYKKIVDTDVPYKKIIATSWKLDDKDDIPF